MEVRPRRLAPDQEEFARFLAELLEGRRYTEAELGFTRGLPPRSRQFVFRATTTPRRALPINLQRSEFVIENPTTAVAGNPVNTDRAEWGNEDLVVGDGLRVLLGGTVSKTGWRGEVWIVAAAGTQFLVVREESVA